MARRETGHEGIHIARGPCDFHVEGDAPIAGEILHHLHQLGGPRGAQLLGLQSPDGSRLGQGRELVGDGGAFEHGQRLALGQPVEYRPAPGERLPDSAVALVHAEAQQRLGGRPVVLAGHVITAQVRSPALGAPRAQQRLDQGDIVDPVVAALADPAGRGRRARGRELGCGHGGGLLPGVRGCEHQDNVPVSFQHRARAPKRQDTKLWKIGDFFWNGRGAGASP